MYKTKRILLFRKIIFPNVAKNVYLCTAKQLNLHMTRTQVINKNRQLFWYTPDGKKQDISDSLLVERILNDGSLDDYRDLISALGGKRVAEVFFSAKGRQKENYYPEIYHFFSLVLSKYAQGDSER